MSKLKVSRRAKNVILDKSKENLEKKKEYKRKKKHYKATNNDIKRTVCQASATEVVGQSCYAIGSRFVDSIKLFVEIGELAKYM